MSRQQIAYDLKTLHQRWLESALVNVDAAKARELAKIDELERTAYEAWEASRSDKETRTAEKTTGGTADRSKAVSRQERRDGNPAYLSIILACIEKRCQILGLNAPKRVTIETVEAFLDSLPFGIGSTARAVLAGTFADDNGPARIPAPAPEDCGQSSSPSSGQPGSVPDPAG